MARLLEERAKNGTELPSAEAPAPVSAFNGWTLHLKEHLAQMAAWFSSLAASSLEFLACFCVCKQCKLQADPAHFWWLVDISLVIAIHF